MIFLKLFITFFKIGLFTFGGGYAMISMIQAEVVKTGWIGETEMINFIAVSESTPGPLAVNMSTYVGMETGGILGAFCATTGLVMPSFIIILIVAKCYEKYKESRVVAGLMSGLKPTVVGLILATVYSVGKTTFFENAIVNGSTDWIRLLVSAGIFVCMVILILKKKHPILIIGLSALFGIVAGYILGI